MCSKSWQLSNNEGRYFQPPPPLLKSAKFRKQTTTALNSIETNRIKKCCSCCCRMSNLWFVVVAARYLYPVALMLENARVCVCVLCYYDYSGSLVFLLLYRNSYAYEIITLQTGNCEPPPPTPLVLTPNASRTKRTCTHIARHIKIIHPFLWAFEF